jgi:hypothetical protein
MHQHGRNPSAFEADRSQQIGLCLGRARYRHPTGGTNFRRTL